MAVLLVVLCHAGVPFLPGGFVGVDVFFVLSGFLITSLLLAEARAKGSVSLLEFYVRRARRILPAAALTLVATDVAAFFLLNFLRAQEAIHDSLAAAVFASNFRFAAHDVDYFAEADPPSAVLHYWSLSVEEQFYFVWPLLLSMALFGVAVKGRSAAAARRNGRRLLVVVAVLTAASLAWSIHATATLPAAAYFSPLARAWELGIGATLAVSASAAGRAAPVARVVMGWGGIAAIGYAAVMYSESTPFPGSAALVPTVGTALAIVAGMGDRSPRLAVTRMLGVRPMRIVGDRSYAFYLWHWPVLVLAAQYAGSELSVAVKLGLIVGAFLLSCGSYTLVENPIRRGMRSRKATGIVVAICIAAFLSTAAVSLGAIDREQRRFEAPVTGALTAPGGLAGSERSARGSALPAVVEAVQAARRNAAIPAGLVPRMGQVRNVPPRYAVPDGCIGQNGRTRIASEICRIGDRSSRRQIVLLGDSHAEMWLPALLEMAWRDHWAVIPLVRLGCTPERWINGSSASCRKWYDWALRRIRRLRPTVTLLGGSIGERPSPSTRGATAGVIAAARALEPLGPVVVIGDPEGLDEGPIDCLLSRRASMARCTTTWPRASLEAYDEVDRTAKQLGVGFLQTRGFACYQRQCPAVVGRMIAWRDNNHLSAVYSAELADAFRAGFLRAVATARR